MRNSTPAQRLAKHRKAAADTVATYGPGNRYADWRVWARGFGARKPRPWGTWSDSNSSPDKGSGLWYCPAVASLQLTAAHDVSRYFAAGWYLDDESGCASGMVVPHVARLSHGRWLAVCMPDRHASDGYMGHDGSVYTDKREAAQAADEMCRILAEHERDYQAEENERQAHEDAIDAARGALREARIAAWCAMSDAALLAHAPDTLDKHGAILRAMDRRDKARRAAREAIQALRGLA